MSDLVREAEAFAREAHGLIQQKRKYSNLPYIVHPEAVAGLVAQVTSDPITIAAAWLHDVVEDTPVTNSVIREKFGDEVSRLVSDLTKPPAPKNTSRAEQKMLERRHSQQADPRAKTVKLADLYDNLKDVLENDPEFAKTYVLEKELQLATLEDGDSTLYVKVKELVDSLKRRM